nr:MAG TPA: hypothetical protein [Caudoviricetes sp.]
MSTLCLINIHLFYPVVNPTKKLNFYSYSSIQKDTSQSARRLYGYTRRILSGEINRFSEPIAVRLLALLLL